MEIQLNGEKGGVAIVSKEDYDRLSKSSWSLNKNGYVKAHINNKNVQMHRYIMNAPEDIFVDHINRKRYDNRQENLRFLDYIKNGQNKQINKENKTSQYRCVNFHKGMKKYRAEIIINSTKTSLGYYKKEIDAAEAVDMYIVHNKLDHIELNFPDKKEIYLKRKYIPFKPKIGSSIYNGISRSGSNYIALITINGKTVHIGRSSNQMTCAKMWDKYVVDNNILNRKLNFPEDYPNYNPNVIRTKFKKINDETIQLILPNHLDKKIYIDIEDYDKVKYLSWYLDKAEYVCSNDNCKHYKLHRIVTNTTDPKIFVDHIDNDVLNNIKINLRMSNEVKNPQNRNKVKNATSQYFGVCSFGEKWVSYNTYKGIKKHIGVDVIEHYAARRRDLYLLDNLPDEYYKLNYKWTNLDIIKWKKILGIKTNTNLIQNVLDIADALFNNNIHLAYKLNAILNKKITFA